ncbi:MAG: MMPL family transporter [Planctomycetaceae bacterium]|nr:MMPL family transporter [Planctomycetaceae bacterium]
MIERFFTYRDPWGQGLTLWIVVAMFFAAPFIFIGLSEVRLENDVTSWLPADDPDAQVLEWFHEHFENESRVLISWEGSSLVDPRVDRFSDALLGQGEFAEQFAERHPEQLIANVGTPHQALETMIGNKIDPEDALARMTGVLIGPGFLKVRWTDEGRQNPGAAQAALQQAIDEAGLDIELTFLPPQELPESPVAVDEESEVEAESLVTFPEHDVQLRATSLTYGSTAASEVQEIARGLDIVEDCFYSPGAPVAISVGLTPEADNQLRPLFAHIYEAAVAAGIPREKLHMGGGAVSRFRLNSEAGRAVWNEEYPAWMVHKRSPIILSTLATVLLAFLLLRSFRLASLVLVASMYITMAVVALIPATGKSLNMVLIVLPNLLMVLTTSGAIHLANYWKHEVQVNPANAIARSVKLAWMPCMLASVTTAVGMASLLTSVLNPVKDFGIYSSIGCIMSLGMVLFGFPAMLAVWPGKAESKTTAASHANAWENFGRWLVRHSTAVVVVCLAVFAGSIYGLRWFETETKLIRYFPPKTQLYQDYEFLEESLAGIVSAEVVVRFPKQPEVDVTDPDYDETAETTPQLNVLQRMEIVRRLEGKLAAHPSVSGTLSLADFRPVSPDPEATASYMLRVRRTDKGIFVDNIEQTKPLATRATQPLSVHTNRLNLDFDEGDELWRIRCQTAVLNDLNYGVLVDELNHIAQAEIDQQQGVDFVVTGMVPLFLRTQEAVLESLIRSFALAFGLIAIIMIVLLRHPISGLLAMLPNLFPVGVVFGLVAWAGIPVDIGTMITASVALGIAIDGTLHLLTWFQEGIRSGMSREEAVVKALNHCGPAMWQTSIAIAVGMSLLFGADLLLISRFGWLMAALVVVALIADVVLLPALLVGWLGAIIERTTQKEPKPATHSSDAEKVEEASDSDVLSFPSAEATDQPLRRAPGM